MILLARHGQTAYNAARRFQGHLPVPLDETGRRQAHVLAALVAGREIGQLWCSPLARARETAEIIAARTGHEIVEDDRFAETHAGDWTDRPFAEIQEEAPELFARFVGADPAFGFPGGESFQEQAQRIAAGLEDARAASPQPVLVVCHGVTIRIAQALAAGTTEGLPPPVDNAALVELA
jgi:broad specificity phosphatase PhoE